MNLGLLLKLLHVLASFWFLAGLVGRGYTFWRAGRAKNVQEIHTLLGVSEFFERCAVIPGGTIVFLFGLLTAWLLRWPILGFLQGAASNWLLVSLVLFVGISVVIGPLRLVQRRKLRDQAAEAALAQGTVTPELTAAVSDKVVRTFRAVEFITVVVIIILMVAKPF